MPLRIAVALYDQMTALDAIGPVELLRFIPKTEVVLVAEGGRAVTTDTGFLELGPTVDFEQVPDPDVVVVPGGPGTAAALGSSLVPWLTSVHAGTRWTTSVCSGSLLLGAAGLLKGLRATSHFAVRDHLDRFGAKPVQERVVVEPQARVITAAGVSAGIDMAVVLIQELTDEVTADAIRLITEYDPAPSRPGGSLSVASSEVVQRAMELGKPHGAIPPGWGPR